MTFLDYLIEAAELLFKLMCAIFGLIFLLRATILQVACYLILHIIMDIVNFVGLLLKSTFFGLGEMIRDDIGVGAFSELIKTLKNKENLTTEQFTIEIILSLLISPIWGLMGFLLFIDYILPVIILENVCFLFYSLGAILQSVISGFALGWDWDLIAIVKCWEDRETQVMKTLDNFSNTLMHPENLWIIMYCTSGVISFDQCGFMYSHIDSDLENKTVVNAKAKIKKEHTFFPEVIPCTVIPCTAIPCTVTDVIDSPVEAIPVTT